LLFKIKNTANDLNIKNARLNYDLAKSNYDGNANLLKEIEEQLSIAQLKLENDSLLYTKQQRLWKKGVGAENTLQNLKLTYEVSQREVESLTNQYKRTKIELNNQLKISKNQIDRAVVSKQDFIVKSQMDGIVFEVKKEVGEAVMPQEPLAVIGSENSFKIDLLIDEEDIAKIQIGQKVIIRLEAYEGQVFEAKITKIAPKMDSRTQTFLVESQFVTLPKRLYMGLSGEANVIISEKANTLLIPKEYLINGNKVMTPDGEVEVKVGLESLEQIEVLSPIDTSSRLIKPE